VKSTRKPTGGGSKKAGRWRHHEIIDAISPALRTGVRQAARSPNIGLCNPNSTTSPLHCASTSTTPWSPSPFVEVLAGQCRSVIQSLYAWRPSRPCLASIPSAGGCALPSSDWDTSFLDCPISRPTTGGCGLPGAYWPTPSRSWPRTLLPGTIDPAAGLDPDAVRELP
jgi:hypothetical protein